ncbi:ABC transporter ATP-binding protein [uncultured Thomasclavelia sp.]|uniref:ABC transporter ATP-binding protein n=1 Tax=uncultured Thomasclavelia sp. TaxID=3025759 RepID=UPI00280A8EE3|nr:ABC transporter ATP-binding protein [uncultured Thomasclavelia sp.]
MKKIKHIIKRIKEGRLKELFEQLAWMAIYVKKYWWLIAIYTFLMTSGSLLSLGSTVVSRDLVDAVTAGNTQIIFSVVFTYVGVGVGQIFINVIRTRISLKIQLKIQNEIREDIFKQIMQTDWEALSEYRTGDLLYRINGDAGMVANSILTFIPTVISVFISFFSAFWIMIQNDYMMAVIALMGAPISLITSRYTMAKMREYTKRNQDFSSNKMAFDQETFQNLQMIKAFGLVPRFIDNFHEVTQESMKISLDQNKFQSLTTIITSLVGQVIGYACYGYALFRLWQGEISYGTMTMFVGMAGSLRGSFSSIVNLAPTLIRACINAQRIIEIITLPRERIQDDKKAKDILSVAGRSGVEILMDNVSFWYQEGQPVYENACFYAKPGEIIGLLGPSGQGKTTTLNLLLGLFHIREGKLKIGNPGHEMIDISSATRCLFGYIPQGNTLFSGTIAQNIAMVKPDATEEEIIEVLKTVCAWEFVEQLEEGIHTSVRELGRRFSEGQKQRLSIARALLADAPVLLLDEATSALDMATEKKVLKNILKRDPLRTLIVAAHRPSVFSMCHRVYRVQDGMIKEANHDEVQKFLEGDE